MDYDLDLQDPEQYELQGRLAEAETPEALLLTDEIRDTVNRAIENFPTICALQSYCGNWKA